MDHNLRYWECTFDNRAEAVRLATLLTRVFGQGGAYLHGHGHDGPPRWTVKFWATSAEHDDLMEIFNK